MSKYEIGDPSDLIATIARLEKRIATLEAGARAGNTAVDAGTLSVTSGMLTVGAGGQIYFGPVVAGSDTTPGWIFRRSDGSVAFYLAGTASNDQYFAFCDNAGNIIISDDSAANQGLARPYISIPFYEHYNKNPTTPNTSSGTFESLAWARMRKQHPKVRVEALIRTSDGTTGGEWQLKNNTSGVIIAGPNTIALGAFSTHTLGPVNVVGDHMSTVELEIQVRRSAGAGSIAMKLAGAYGEQS